MSNITHGMNVEEVRRLGADLRSLGDRLDEMAKRLDGCVSGATWTGPDSKKFKQDWWPKHRSNLQGIANDLRGFGDSAKNNADEQERTSGGTGGSSDLGMAQPMPMPPNGPVPGPIGIGSLGGSRSWQEVDAAYRQNAAAYGMGAYGPGGAYQYQCTAWAMFRWRELGVTGPIGDGHGWQKAALNGGSTSTPPSLGAMASYGNGQAGNYGHVMVVEEVTTSADGSPQIRVSEWNVVDTDYENGHANEFRSDRIFSKNADGTWSVGGRNVGQISFAGLPK